MSTTDGKTPTRPLRRRQSKRFDRSGGSPSATTSTVVDAGDDDVEVDVPEPVRDESVGEPSASTTATEIDRTPSSETEPAPEPDDDGDAPPPATPAAIESSAPDDGASIRKADAAGRSRTFDQIAPCGRCGHDVSIVHIEVDGNILMMESCDNCDTRRWQLAGEPIELQQALDHVGEHTGRRR